MGQYAYITTTRSFICLLIESTNKCSVTVHLDIVELSTGHGGLHGPVSGASSCGSRLYPKDLLPIKKAVKTSGALGGVNCAEASAAVTTASSSARLSETAEKV